MKTHDFMMMDLKHTGEHLDIIKDDPTRAPEFQKYTRQYDELLKVYRAIDSMTQKMQQDMEANRQAELAKLQGQPKIDQEAELKMAKIQADTALAQAKEQNMQKIREEKAAHGMGVKSAMAEQKMNIEAARAAQPAR